jgi:hypothetical protein
MNFNAKGAKGIRKGTQRRPCSATFAQNFATFAVKFNDSLHLKLWESAFRAMTERGDDQLLDKDLTRWDATEWHW